MKRLSISIVNNSGIELLDPKKLATLTANLTLLAGFTSRAVHFDNGRYLHWVAETNDENNKKTLIFEVTIRVRQKGNRKVLKTLTGIVISDFGCRRKNPTCGYVTPEAFGKILAKELRD